MSTETRDPEILGVSITFTVLAFVFVAIRFWARVIILRNGGVDEIIIGCSLLCSLIFLAFTVLQVANGMGRHSDTLTAQEIEPILKYLWASILFYYASLTLTKISIIVQYLRVFSISYHFRAACWTVIGIVCSYATYAIISGIFTCVPVSSYWDRTLEGRCIPNKFLAFFNASMNIATDAMILLLPMPLISKLKLPMRQRMGLMMIFALGGFVCLVSILRLHSLHAIESPDDQTWTLIPASIWSAVECNVGIICASLPTIKPVISLLFPRFLSSNRSTGPNLPSTYIQSGFHSRSRARQTHIPLDDVGGNAKTVTKVEAVDNNRTDVADGRRKTGPEKEILVMSTTTQYIESKSEVGSEKDLIFPR